MAILDLRNIDKNYGQGPVEVPALKQVSLQVEEGEYIAIMGPSGSGKSTLMNIIGCLDRASAGEYYLDGEDISSLSEKELSEIRLKKVGFVFQTFQLLPQETALENVALPLVYAGIDKQERRERALESLRNVGLEDRADFVPTQLSGGQKQRVAIARAMINDPKVLLADEPTGALDQASGMQVMELFEELNAQGTTVVMITHDANVASHARRVVHIVDGRLGEGAYVEDEDMETESAADMGYEDIDAEADSVYEEDADADADTDMDDEYEEVESDADAEDFEEGSEDER